MLLNSFWVEWYRRVLEGHPPNWPLLRDVALIDDAVWQVGGRRSLIEEAASCGSPVVRQEAGDPPRQGSFLAPTLTDVPSHARIMNEKVFLLGIVFCVGASKA